MERPGTTGDGSGDVEIVSYREFGQQFFTQVVTEERVLGAVNMLAGQPIEFGPTGVGPGRLVKLTARGAIGDARSEPVRGGEAIAFRMVLPVDLSFEVDLGVEVHRFTARLSVPLVLTARALAGLKIYIDVEPPHSHQIGIRLRAEGLRASVLQRVAGVEGEVKRFVAKYVGREIAKPYVRQACTIDIGAQVDKAWERIAPRSPSPTADHITGDLRDAIQEEISASSGATAGTDPGVTAPVRRTST